MTAPDPRRLLVSCGVVLCLLGAWVPSLGQGSRATVSLKVTLLGEPLLEPTRCKFYIYEPEKREQYLGWGHPEKTVRVEAGTYDIVVHYKNDLVIGRRTFKKVNVAGKYVVKVDFKLAEAELQLDITRGGEPAPRFAAQYQIHEAGKRGKPLTTRRPGTTVVLEPGYYDIEVKLRDGRGLKSTWLENYLIENRTSDAIEMGLPPTRLTLEIVENGRQREDSGVRFAVFRTGESRRPFREGRSGEPLGLPEGRYDIALYDRQSSRRDPVRWIRDLVVRGETRREVELRPQAATRLTINIKNGGQSLDRGWFHVYRVGDRRRPIQVAGSGETIEIEEGVYDIAGFVHEQGLVGERWLPGRRVAGPTDVNLDLLLEPASLQVDPSASSSTKPRTRRREVLVLLDSSSAMGESLGNASRLRAVRQELIDALEILEKDDVKLGLRAFGIAPESQRNCRDSARLLPTKPIDLRRLSRSLDLLRPGGYSPIADTLRRVEDDANKDAYTIVVLVTGSYENCGGDPCAAAARLLYQGIANEIHVVGVGLDKTRTSNLICVGPLHTVDGRRRLRTELRRVARAIQVGSADSVSVFRPGGGEWIVTAPLGQPITMAAGRYDLQIRSGGKNFRWSDVEIKDRLVVRAGEQP
ncbi:MAG: hypothetical protein OEV00_06800 [Acidobacteriota bacterium]|nr:hypothetical protein [Acidobacteriota bacterium]MDH3785019.1 hypothetical protein [Acidobacteriota bacterium]